MTVEQAIAVIGALTALLVAVGALISDVRALRQLVDGRMADLLLLAQLAAKKQGELEGRDWHPTAGGTADQPEPQHIGGVAENDKTD